MTPGCGVKQKYKNEKYKFSRFWRQKHIMLENLLKVARTKDI